MDKNELLLFNIGRKIKFLRIKAGYTSHENFAFEYDMSSSYYWKAEKGKVNISVVYLQKILSIHQISFEEFFKNILDFE